MNKYVQNVHDVSKGGNKDDLWCQKTRDSIKTLIYLVKHREMHDYTQRINKAYI